MVDVERASAASFLWKRCQLHVINVRFSRKPLASSSEAAGARKRQQRLQVSRRVESNGHDSAIRESCSPRIISWLAGGHFYAAASGQPSSNNPATAKMESHSASWIVGPTSARRLICWARARWAERVHRERQRLQVEARPASTELASRAPELCRLLALTVMLMAGNDSRLPRTGSAIIGRFSLDPTAKTASRFAVFGSIHQSQEALWRLLLCLRLQSSLQINACRALVLVFVLARLNFISHERARLVKVVWQPERR